MSEIVVVYELDQPAAGHAPPAGAPGSPGAPGTAWAPRRVHAAPAAPGRSGAAGPRTLCGKDTFAMDKGRRMSAEEPETPWYPAEHASRVCPDCAAVMET
ncbi:hypothetical protein [Streptomyces sp. IBSBF 3136]|uniref:hypothetical protein n=1 Tax=Streptomyces sp. IBSBF 3136 TaxID=2903524 RepID=UPI002FDC6193